MKKLQRLVIGETKIDDKSKKSKLIWTENQKGKKLDIVDCGGCAQRNGQSAPCKRPTFSKYMIEVEMTEKGLTKMQKSG